MDSTGGIMNEVEEPRPKKLTDQEKEDLANEERDETWNVVSRGSSHATGMNRATRKRMVRKGATRQERQYARDIRALQLRLKLRGEEE
jgi:hypothetical protein